MQPVYVFDAYGTLFDVHSAVARHADLVGENASLLSAVWRAKQLEYSWVHSLMDRYVEFWRLTERALDFAFDAAQGANRDAREQLLEAYNSLSAYSEVTPVLHALKDAGHATAILSNGSPDMLHNAVHSAGLQPLIDECISVDPLRIFKTDPLAYQMVCDQFQVEAHDVIFQSSNRWDIAGAKAFGFQCNWINRTGQPDEYPDQRPDNVLSDLTGLLQNSARVASS